MTALLTDDVFLSMPPLPLEYEGLDVATHFCASTIGSGRRFGTGLLVLTLTGDRICSVTRFDTSVLPWFGLPRSLPSR